MARFDRIEPEEHADLRIILDGNYDARDHEYHSGGAAWLVGILLLMTVMLGFGAFYTAAAIAGAGSMPAYCATLECAVAGGL